MKVMLLFVGSIGKKAGLNDNVEVAQSGPRRWIATPLSLVRIQSSTPWPVVALA